MLRSELLDQLETGSLALDEMLHTQRQPGERTALMRCAVPLSFDENLAQELLLPGTELAFENLIALDDIEKLPRTNRFRVCAAARSSLWRQWWDAEPGTDIMRIPAGLAALLGSLADYSATNGQLLDQLAATLLIDPAAALALFDSAYALADSATDLLACQDLIDVLSDPDRQLLLSPEIRERRTRQQAYLVARQRFSKEWFSTARYLEPAGVVIRYLEMVAVGGPRTLNLYARGGRGKTIQLRWLVSRRLVPDAAIGGLAAGRIPCAMVDFDFVDPVNATRDPWLLLTEIAGQLDTQLATPLFTSLLDQIGWAAPLLRQQAATDARVATAVTRLREQSADVAARAIRRFQEILADRPADQPIMLIFDTIEEIHLRPEGDLRALVGMLTELLDGIPALRIILAGRYPIREILGEVADSLPDMLAEEVHPFTTEMARQYLWRGRAIPPGPVQDAVADKADGDPFLLSLLADVVQVEPTLSPSEIRAYSADVVYLINRVVRRIPERGVRWLLRYGVVPRRLTLQFVQLVMADPLLQAMTGRSEHDRPDNDDVPSKSPDDPIFSPLADPAAAPPLADLWEQLRRYAGSTSWVFEDPSAPDALLFRPEVVAPMRAILRRHPVFRLLHTKAIAFYELRAAAEPARWAEWTREAIYHRFQRDGASAVDVWEAAIAHAESDPVQQEALANEVLGPDYLDRSEPITGALGEPLVSRDTIARAQLIRSSALVRQAGSRRVAAGDRLWTEAARSLQFALDAAKHDPSIELSALTIAYVEAAFALRNHDTSAARRLVSQALDGAGDGPDRVRLLVLLGDIDGELGRPDASDHFREALAATTDPVQRNVIVGRIMLAEAAKDAYDEAMDACDRALAAAGTAAERSTLLNFRAVMDLNCGNANDAGNALAEAGSLSGDTWSAKLAEVALVQRNPLLAASLLQQVSARSGIPMAEQAELTEAEGRAATALLDRVTAAAKLQAARKAWREIGDSDGSARCLAMLIALEMREIGNLTLAARHLEDADTSTNTLPNGAWLTNRLLHAELYSRLGRIDDAAADIGETVALLKSRSVRPTLRARGIVGALALGRNEDQAALLEELATLLARVTPAAARVQTLGGALSARWMRARISPTGWDRLRPLLNDPADGLRGVDAAERDLILADIDMWAGDPDTARRRLQSARDGFEQSPSTFWFRSWCRTADRIAPELAVRESADVQRFAEEWRAYPMLAEAFLVERAEAMLRIGHPAVQLTLGLAEAVEERLDGEPTQWQVRRLEAQATALERSVGDPGPGQDRSFIQTWRSTARRTATLLGQPATSESRTGPNALDALRENRIPISLSATDSGVAFTAFPPGSRIISRIEGPDVRERGMAFIEKAAFWWLDRFRDVEGLLPAIQSQSDRSGGPLQARLFAEVPQLHAFPWEDILGRTVDVLRIRGEEAAEHDEIAYVQAALQAIGRIGLAIDADFGTVSMAALSAYQKEVGLPADGLINEWVLDRLQTDPATRARGKGPSVLILQQNAQDLLTSNISSSNYGTDLAALYHRGGFRVNQLEPAGMSALISAVRSMISSSEVPTVLHLAGGIRDTGDGLTLTFGSGNWESEAYSGSGIDDYAPAALDSLIRLFPTGPTAPLVVLDIEAPPSPSELAIQLFQRNAFAADLFALGRAPAVLATGLVGSLNTYGNRFQSTPSADRLISAMVQGYSLLEIVRAVRTVEQDQPGRPQTALFTHLSWLRPVV